MIDINFNDLGMPVFTGRSRGEESRRRLRLDSLPDDESVRVIIPDDVYTITSSYFLGLFGPSVRKAGSRDKFLQQYSFQAPAHVKDKLGDFVTRALRDQEDLF